MEENIKMLMFLVDEYNLKYSVQTFNNYPFGNYKTKTFSFYNDSGCFTIRYLLQKDELDFYFSSRFSNECKELQERLINIWIDEPEIWKKHQKWIVSLKDPLFWLKKKKVIKALAETIKTKIDKNKTVIIVVSVVIVVLIILILILIPVIKNYNRRKNDPWHLI